MKFFVQWAIISNFFRADPIPLDPFRCSVLFSSYIEFPNGVYLFRGATIFLSQIKVRHFKLLLQAYEFNGNALSDFFTFYKQNNNKNVKKLDYRIWQSVAVKFIHLQTGNFFTVVQTSLSGVRRGFMPPQLKIFLQKSMKNVKY